MAAVTLEELVKRVEALEARHGVLPPGAIPLKPPYYALPGTGDWAAAFAAIEALQDSDYDWDAVAKQDAIDIEDMKHNAERWG